MVKLDTHEVAKWFIYNNPELAYGYLDENVKLNKLLYFSNLMYYCVEKENLLDEEFIAFPKGPVVFSIYRDYRFKGLNAMPISDDVRNLGSEQRQILNIISFVYGNKDANELIDETHRHSLWKDVSCFIPNNPQIDFSKTDDNLISFFCALYNAYKDFDFSDIKKEKINGNIFYYSKSNFELTDDIISELIHFEKSDTPRFIEIIDDELVVS